MPVTSQGYYVNKQPIAQSFFIDEPKGIFATKVDLYFATRDDPSTTQLPVQIQLRPMVNGFPSSSHVIPGSIVVKAASDVAVDTTGPDLTPTAFEFEEPIFLKGFEDYALVVIADSKDYSLYIAEIDEFAFGSTEKRVAKNPTSGSLFYTQNGVTFTPAQNQDLTFRLHRASFKHTSGTVSLKNASVPKAHLLSPPFKVTSGSTNVVVKHLNSGLQVGDKVTFSGAESCGGISADTLNANGGYAITKTDWSGYSFTAGSAATSSAFGGGGKVLASKNIPYSIIQPNVEVLQPTDTTVEAQMKATTGKSFAGNETPFIRDTNFNPIKLNENNYSKVPLIIGHDSAEASYNTPAVFDSSERSLEFQISFGSNDSNVSPMIDMQRTSATLFDNIIDKQQDSSTSTPGFFNAPVRFLNETHSNGSAAAKHLTRVVTLSNDAVGLKVMLNANKPQGTDIQLFFRTATGDEDINKKAFAEQTIENAVPNTNNLTIFSGHTYLIGGQNGSLPAFTKFQLKIVFRSVNSARVPVLSSLRVIALSV